MHKLSLISKVALGLVVLLTPRAIRADSIVQVTITGVVFNGNSICGSSGSSLCTETASASFRWDNTTNTYVTGTLATFTSGDLGVIPPVAPGLATDPISFGNGEVLLLLTQVIGDTEISFDLNQNSSNRLPLGPYTLLPSAFAPRPPGTVLAALVCGGFSSPCQGDYPPLSGGPADGAITTVGTVTVTPAVPEPSSLLLLGSGLLGLVSAACQRRCRNSQSAV